MKKNKALEIGTRPIILVVDDARSNQEILVALLKRDYQVKVAGCGLRALEIAQSKPQPDLILLDVNLPDIDGYEVYRRLQHSPFSHDISVIFITADADVNSEVYGLQLGAVDYISKPISAAVTQLRVRNHLLLKQSLNKLRLTAKVFETTMESIIVTDAQCKILDVNPAFCRLTGYNRNEVLGKTPGFLHSGYHDWRLYSEMWQSINETGYWSGELWNRNKEGDVYPELISISAIVDEQGTVTHYVGIASDITLLKQHEQQLERIAHYDALTGIPNRVLLADRMKQAIALAKREQKMLGVCYLDLDGFKPINDNYGHLAGDQVLVEIARRISEALREYDTVARLGGDEFVVLLPGLQHQDECISTVKRLLEIIAQPVFVMDHSFSLTASIGVSIFPQDKNDPDVLLRHADQSMYLAKQTGKNRFQTYDPSYDQRSRTRNEFKQCLWKALENQEFELYYQPKIELFNKAIIGVEALIRWLHPERGLLLPGDFLINLNDVELEIRLGEWVIDNALQQVKNWLDGGLNLKISVNIDACHLQSKGFVDYLKQMVVKYPDLSFGHLHIEILETAALEDFSTAIATIEACRKLGVSFALDDFGTGYSSLTYLQRLPIDTLKIDRSFIRNMLADKSDQAIVQGVIILAKALGQRTVAEGIETAEHLQVLLDMGCEFGQGYTIARPMPAADLPMWVRKHNGSFCQDVPI